MPSFSRAAHAAPRAGRTPLNLGYLVKPARQDLSRQPIRSREAELEATVADRLRAAIAELQAAQAAAVAVGYGDQFCNEVDHAIDQVELTRRMLA